MTEAPSLSPTHPRTGTPSPSLRARAPDCNGALRRADRNAGGGVVRGPEAARFQLRDRARGLVE